MNGILDGFLVGLVLAAGFGYAAYALAPTGVRTRLSRRLSWLVGHAPTAWRLGGVAARLAAATDKAAGSCGGCESCAAAPPTGPLPDAGSDIRIPVSAIGKRRS